MGPSLSYKTLKEYGWRVIPNITSRFYIINGKIFYPWETARIGTSRRRSGHFNKKISCIITTYFFFLREAARTVHMKSGHFIKNFSCIITNFFFFLNWRTHELYFFLCYGSAWFESHQQTYCQSCFIKHLMITLLCHLPCFLYCTHVSKNSIVGNVGFGRLRSFS